MSNNNSFDFGKVLHNALLLINSLYYYSIEVSQQILAIHYNSMVIVGFILLVTLMWYIILFFLASFWFEKFDRRYHNHIKAKFPTSL